MTTRRRRTHRAAPLKPSVHRGDVHPGSLTVARSAASRVRYSGSSISPAANRPASTSAGDADGILDDRLGVRTKDEISQNTNAQNTTIDEAMTNHDHQPP